MLFHTRILIRENNYYIMNNLKCPQCGSPNTVQVDIDHYECPYCGTSFNSQYAAQAQAVVEKRIEQQKKNYERSGKGIMILTGTLFVIALLAIGGYASYALLNDAKNKRMHKPEVILERVKLIFGHDEYFSEDYKSTEKDLMELANEYYVDGVVGPDYIVWDSSQGGCIQCGVTTFGEVYDITEKYAKIKVFNHYDCTCDHNILLTLVFENGNWFIDEIENAFGRVKERMKEEMEQIKQNCEKR